VAKLNPIQVVLFMAVAVAIILIAMLGMTVIAIILRILFHPITWFVVILFFVYKYFKRKTA